MPAYHIAGPSGSGKSHLGRELADRGYRVIETDFEPGLSGWVNTATGERVTEPAQPFPAAWVAAHQWLWDEAIMRRLLDESITERVFFVGGADNETAFFPLFQRRFGLYVDTPTIVKRVQEREPERWVDGSAELLRLVEWNDQARAYNLAHGAIPVNSATPVEVLADIILDYIADERK